MKKCCLNCHFLMKSTPSEAGKPLRFSWNKQELSQFRVSDHYAAECAQGVWDTGIDPGLNTQLREILQKKRGNSCFFIERQPGMSIPAAEKLQAHEATKKANRRATIALWISFASLITGVGLALVDC